MIKRSLLKYLEQWRDSDTRKPLILRGARQVGKTTVVNEFGKQFSNYLYFNLEQSQDRFAFEQDIPLDDRINLLYALRGQQKNPGSTLLFIDEIQNSSATIALLRYFYEQRNDLHVVAAGSLLENLVDMKTSFPVGRVEFAAVRPCSFIEFAEAAGFASQLDYAINNPTSSSPLHSTLMSLFNQYTIVGGMPEAVDLYLRNRDVIATNAVYETLLTAYRDDVEKYVNHSKLVDAVRFILKYGWASAAQTITLGNFAGSQYNSKVIRESFQLLEKAMLAELVYPTIATSVPAFGETKRAPKLIWLDTGLVNYAAQVRQEIIAAPNIMDAWRGRIAEHVVAQELLTLNHRVGQERVFWIKNGGGGSAEVDFLWTYNSQLFPIEVKSGHNAHLRSLHAFIDKSAGDIAVRVWNEPFSVESQTTTIGRKPFRLVNLPFYLVGSLETILSHV